MEAQAIGQENPFAQAELRFASMRAQLSDRRTARLTHGDLERWIEGNGRELLRELLQGHLVWRGVGRVEAGHVEGADGVDRQQRRERVRTLLTTVGEVVVPRTLYEQPEHGSLCPRDAELNLLPTRYSHGVEQRMAETAAHSSFEVSVSQVARAIGTTLPKRQAEQMAVRASADFDAFYASRVAASAAAVQASGPVLVLSVDGKGVVMRSEDLREPTRRQASQRRSKLASRRCKGEKAGTKRIATVAAVYTTQRFARVPEDIVREFAPVRSAALVRPRPEDKRVWASLQKSVRSVIAEVFDEAQRRDPRGAKSWVALVDGNRTQIDLMEREARRRKLAVPILLDVVHVREYLWKAAYVFHAEGSRDAESWVNARMLEILRGRAGQVAGGMRRSATKRGIAAAARKAVDVCARYLRKHKRYLRYDAALAVGFPIATGVIEGACRHLIKDRMDITGARWSLAGAEAVLRLRALRSSGDFQQYWDFHEARDYERHHAVHYANATPPRTVLPRLAHSLPALHLVH